MTITDADGYVYWFNLKGELLAWQPPKHPPKGEQHDTE